MPARGAESRALDQYYDPVYTTPTSDNGAYRATIPAVLADGGKPVQGPNQYKYLTRPMLPQLRSVAPEVLLAPESHVNPLEPPAPADEPFSKEAGTQSLYRESEVQTLPYSPEFILSDASQEPKLLMLQGLVTSQGLPGGLREVEMFEQAQTKRAMEASLLPFTDEASLSVRKRLMQVQEVRELRMREQELNRARNARLAVLRRAISERDQGNQFLAEQRLEALRQAKLERQERKVAHIQRTRIKVLRKLTKARPSSMGSFEPSTHSQIIGQYADFGSRVYAPVQREGRLLANKANSKMRLTNQVARMTSFGGLAALESSLRPSLTQSLRKKPSKTKPRAATTLERKAAAVAADLERLDQSLRAKEEGTELPSQGVKEGGVPGGRSTGQSAWRTQGVQKDRPPTPVVTRPPVREVANAALLLLQRLLRGRAVQNTMFEGKERRRELIRELRRAASAEAEEMLRAAEAAQEIHRRQATNAALDTIAGSMVSLTGGKLAAAAAAAT